jgi:hypothetical protein
MKKGAVLILSFIYLIFSSGFVVQQHFCMDKLVAGNSAAERGDQCGNCGMHKKEAGDCCKDIHKIVKADTHQKINESDSPSLPFSFIVPHNYLSLYQLPVTRQHLALPQTSAPPLHGGIPVYIFDCVFLI